jgi:cell wall-associated NlpC family hydrolase
MIRAKHFIFICCMAGFIVGCGVSERTLEPPSSARGSSGESQSEPLPPVISVSKYNEVQASLEQAYRDWQGTPYAFGGISTAGIDCSAFMQVIFDDYFGINLPRDTKNQLYAGHSIRRKSLNTGDLVFFKTGRKTLHVGVIIEDDEFLHASTSQGVTTSKLDSNYWQSRYLSARRVMQLQ